MDFDRMNNGTVDGSGTNAGGVLYLNLVDAENLVYTVMAINPDGTFTLAEIIPGVYLLQLTTLPGAIGSPPPLSVLPDNWIFTGEYLGAGAGSDGMADGVLSISVENNLNIGNAKFGIVKLADITTTITTTPNIINGITSFNVVVKVSELNQADTYGSVVLAIPKDSRWILDGSYDPNLELLNLTELNNGDWIYSSNESYHLFEHSSIVKGGTFTSFGFKAIFNPGSTKGEFTITAQIVSGSGGETQVINGSDSEKLDYFSK